MTSTQMPQEPPPMPKTELSPKLASLANATEPHNASNQQQSPVGTFPQRPTGTTASPPTNAQSPFGNFSFGPNSGLSFTNSSLKEKPEFNFSGSASGPGPFTFGGFTTNSQGQQPMQSFTITPSRQQESLNEKSQVSSFNPSVKTTPPPSHIAAPTQSSTKQMTSIQPPNATTPLAQHASATNQEQEETDVPLSLAEMKLLEKKVNTKLRDSGTLVVDRNDPTSPLHSLKSFEELKLKPELLKGIYGMGFVSPSRIQEIALPLLLNNPPRNIIAQSQSGTGKTAAFSLAILSRIDPSIKTTQALILSPTYELAIQIGSVLEKMAQYIPFIRIAYAVRNSSTNATRGQLLSEPVVIGTPGTIEEWCRKRKVIDLKMLSICCIDEADVMIATQGFQEMCVNLVRNLNPSTCQMMLFSATYSDEIMDFARQVVPNPYVLRLKREKQTLNNIRQFYINCFSPEQKFQAIEQIYAHLTLGQAMIFCRTKATARDLAIRMAGVGHSVRELTAALDIDQRASVIRQFRDRVFNALISTNVTARGIDIDDVSLVVNYDMPVLTDFSPDFETYLHRIGRCGRFGKLGYTFNLIASEKDFNIMKAIEQYFNHPIQEITIEGISELEMTEV